MMNPEQLAALKEQRENVAKVLQFLDGLIDQNMPAEAPSDAVPNEAEAPNNDKKSADTDVAKPPSMPPSAESVPAATSDESSAKGDAPNDNEVKAVEEDSTAPAPKVVEEAPDQKVADTSSEEAPKTDPPGASTSEDQSAPKEALTPDATKEEDQTNDPKPAQEPTEVTEQADAAPSPPPVAEPADLPAAVPDADSATSPAEAEKKPSTPPPPADPAPVEQPTAAPEAPAPVNQVATDGGEKPST